MPGDMLGDLAARRQRSREDEADLPLLENVAHPIAGSGLRSAIRDELESERSAIVVRRLLRVPDEELDVVGPVYRKNILRRCWCGLRLRGHGCSVRLAG